MKYGLKTIQDLRIKLEPDVLVVSITNNCGLTKGKVYKISLCGIFENGIINDNGSFVTDMSLFVLEKDWVERKRDFNLRKLGI